MPYESKPLLDLCLDAEARAAVTCTTTSVPDLDLCQTELETLCGALDDAVNAKDREADGKRAELAQLKNDANELDTRRKALKRRAEQCKRAAISLRIQAREITPFRPR